MTDKLKLSNPQSDEPSKKIEIFSELVEKWPYISSIGFIKKSAIPIAATNNISERYLLTLENKKNRTIEMTYFEMNEKEIVNINVSNTESKDFFNVRTWLKYQNLPHSFDLFYLKYRPGDFQDRVENFLEQWQEIFSNEELILILKGDIWVHITFDWSGMR